MATLGQQLRTAREAKGVSESEAGRATKILTKLIIAMEADDFSGMAAPTYAKGFIRLYAQYLGLNSEPLVAEYLEKHAPNRKPLIDEASQLEQNTRRPVTFSFNLKWLPVSINPASWLDVPTQLFSKVKGKWPALSVKDVRLLAAGAAALLVLIILGISVSNCARRHAVDQSVSAAQAPAARMLLDEPLPDLYLVEPGKIEQKSAVANRK